MRNAPALLSTYRTGLQSALRRFEASRDVFSANEARRYLAGVEFAQAELERAPEFFGPIVLREFGGNDRGKAIEGLIGREKMQRSEAA